MVAETIPDDFFDELIAEFGSPAAAPQAHVSAPAPPSAAPSLDNGLYLGTGQAAVAHPGGPVSHLATDNVVGCLGIVVQNPQTGSVGLVHIMANHNMGDFQDEWNDFLKPTIESVSPNGGAVNFHVFGGIYPPEGQVTGQHFSSSIMNMLENVPNGNIVSANLGDKPHPAGIIVDVNSGAMTPTSEMITTHEQGAAYFERQQGALVDLSSMPRADVDPLAFGLVYNQDRPAGLDTPRPAAPSPAPAPIAAELAKPAALYGDGDTVILPRPEATRLDTSAQATLVQFDGANPFPAALQGEQTFIQPFDGNNPFPAALQGEQTFVQPFDGKVELSSPHTPAAPAAHMPAMPVMQEASGFLAQAAGHLSHVGRNSGMIGGAVLGAAAGTFTLFESGSLTAAAQTLYETAVPYGETQIALAQGNYQTAANSATIETASNLGGMGGAIAGAAAGAAIGSFVPVVGTAIGAAAGAVIGGVGVGVASAAVTQTVLEHGQAIVDTASDVANSVADFASDTASTVGDYASSAWTSLSSYFNDAAEPPSIALPLQAEVNAQYAQQIASDASIRSPAVEPVSIRTPMAWERTQSLAAYGGHDVREGSFGSSIDLDDPSSRGALSARVFGPALAADRDAMSPGEPLQTQPAVAPTLAQPAYRQAAFGA